MVKHFLILFIFFFNFETQSSDELEITADQFTYDKENTRIYATGDVSIIDDKFKLNAQKVFLNNTTNVLSAREDVIIFNSDGSILKAKKIVADQELKNAIIEDNFLYIPSGEFQDKQNYLRLAAKKVERRGEYWEKLESGVFTACEICFNKKTNKYDQPLVQLRAKKIIHDKKSLNVKYYNTFVDFKGKSIFYLPYFSHASPLVKRKSGFISPAFRQNHYFGLSTDLPYYIPISDYQDITLKPKFSQKKNPALFVEHRKNFFNGEITSEISGTIENKKKTYDIKEDTKRGHIKSYGKFDLDKNSFLDFKVHRTTDRNYLNTYKYGYSDTLESFLRFKNYRNLNFYSFESYLFQDLRKNINQKGIPKIMPRFIIDLNSKKKMNSLNFESQIELANLIRTEGNETKKLFVNQNIFYPTIFRDGTYLKLGAHLNGGVYHLEKYQNPKNGKYEFNQFRSIFHPQFTVEIEKPYVKRTKQYKTIIKPRVLFLKTTPSAFNRKIPDESNVNNSDVDYYDLFNKNRLSGNDRSDSINRLDYGLHFLKQSNISQITSKIGIAQSYQFDDHNYLPKNSGISDKFSNILADLEVSPSKFVKFNSIFSVNKNNFSIKNAYSTMLINFKNTYLSINNIKAPAVLNNVGEEIIEGKNQYNFMFEQKLSDYWSFSTSSTFDKKKKLKFHNIDAKIKYEDECLGVSFDWKRQYTHNPEDPTSNSFLFLFTLKEIMENDI